MASLLPIGDFDFSFLFSLRLLQSPAVSFLVQPIENSLALTGASTALICLLVALLQPLLPHAWRVKLILSDAKLGYRLADPRSSQSEAMAAKGVPVDVSRAISRATSCHVNCFEALPLFCAAVLAALFAGVARPLVDRAAVVFIALRFIYIIVFLFSTSNFMGN